jgi:hypothetical protein
MNRWWIIAVAALIISAGHTASARAQFPIGGYAPPQMPAPSPFSPYLNLNRAGTQPGINYYGLVRPQIQTQQQLQALQYQQGAQAIDLGAGLVVPGQQVPIATTGHPVYYFDFARFFPVGGLPNGVGAGFGVGAPGLGGYGGMGGFGIGRGIGATGIGVVAPR